MNLLYLGIDLMLTIFVFLAFPIYYVAVKGRVQKKKARKLALINSIVCVALFIIVVGVLTNWETSAVNLAPGVCYYFIAKGILTDPLAKDEPDKKSERFSHAEDETESKKSNIGSSSEIYDEELSLTNDMLQRKKTIIRCQYVATILISLLVLFVVIFPSAVAGSKDKALPTNSTTARLSSLDSNAEVYYETSGSFTYIYCREDGAIKLYSFADESRYTSTNTERSGYATLAQIKTYFGKNIFRGKPSLSFVFPYFVPVIITVPLTLLMCIVLSVFLIAKNARDLTRLLVKRSKFLSSLKKKYLNDDVSKVYFRNQQKKYLSYNIIENNKFFSIFRNLY